MRPTADRSAPAKDQIAALKSLRSMLKAMMAARIIEVIMKPWDMAMTPPMKISAPNLGAAWKSVEPAARSEDSISSKAQVANEGKSPTATARACGLGVSWKA